MTNLKEIKKGPTFSPKEANPLFFYDGGDLLQSHAIV